MSNSNLVIGLTGGIGSGKTAASDWFATKGIDVVDADVIAREVVAVGSDGLAQIQQVFGSWVVAEDGSLNRQALREHIFSNPKARESLESITHPAIRDRIISQLADVSSCYAILAVPLLLEGGESGLKSLCNRILVVDVPVVIQKQRAGVRDHQTAEQIEKIIQSQISRNDRLAQADDIVDNSKDITYLHGQLLVLHDTYMQLANPC